MKAMLSAFVAIIVIAAVAYYGLSEYAGFSAADRTTVGESVRLD